MLKNFESLNLTFAFLKLLLLIIINFGGKIMYLIWDRAEELAATAGKKI